ncbi:Lnb N-terminal periplasmic domain-containing protein [Comamonas koreensis]|uniref:DUF4105 domain-containing protein n=1 Tax=Comamonas koreensis TaxID=160825 RepID=A0AAW4XTV4_9BURK|nr:DUF4105 domain-containing protein [Comamonas koreensis]MCD2164473.1 DUF4105 domain-containing protein [Comamonas koreensis]
MRIAAFFIVLVKLLASLLMLLGVVWACGALWFQLAQSVKSGSARGLLLGVWVGVGLYCIYLLWQQRMPKGLLIYGLLFAAILAWWASIQPSNTRKWAPDVAQQLSGTVQGDLVQLHNVRNFDWQTPSKATARWEDRNYDLRQLVSVDMSTSYWMGPAIAHTLVSFGFDDGKNPRRYVTFSVEIRKEQGEQFSAVGGFFKQFEQSLVAADERDILRVRSNIRGEEVYLYSVAMPRAAMRSLFIAYVDKANALVETPQFYHTLFANCTTIVFDMVRRIVPGLPMDWRLLASGYLPQYVDSLGALARPNDFEAIRAAAHINARAKAVRPGEDFSAAIRQGVPQVPQQP